MIYGITGHRPEKLNLYTDDQHRLLINFAFLVPNQNTKDIYICGMQSGFDLAVASQAILLGHDVIAAIPFTGFKPKGNIWISLYNFIVTAAKESIIVSPGPYAVWKLMERNKYIVDNCDEVIALWNGEKSGTSHCVEYAESKGIIVTNCYKKWKQYEKERIKPNNHS